MNTWDRIKSIQEKLVETLEAADYGAITVNEVVVGSKQKSSKFRPPLLWVVPMKSPIDDTSFALNETWKLKFLILGVIKTYEPEEGKEKAEELALRASASLLADRTLGGLDIDLVRTGWIPGHEKVTDDAAMFGAGVEIEIRFETREA